MSRLSKNIIYNFVGQGLVLVLGFVAVKYVFKQLGEDALGIIYFTLAMNGVLVAVLDLGICSTTVREVSAHFNGEPGYIRELIRTASLFFWSGYLLLAVVIYFGAPLLVEHWIHLETMDPASATRVVQILGISAAVALPRSLYGSLFRGMERMEFNNIIDVATNALQQFGIIAILAFGGGLLPVVYWLAVSFGLGMLCYVLVAQRFFPWRALVPGYYSAVVRRNLGYSSNMMWITLLATVHIQADKLIVSKLLPIGLLGYYSFAYGAVSKATLLTTAVAQAAFPSFASLFQARDRERMISQYQKLQDLLCFGTVPILAAMPFAVLPVFGFVFSPDVAGKLLLPVTFLSLGFYMNGALNVLFVLSLAAGRPDISVRSNLYGLFIVIPVTGVLIYFFGLTGAGVSWVFYHLFAYAYAVRRIYSECLGMPASEWYRNLLKILALSSGIYGAAWLFVAFGSTFTLQSLAMAYLAASLCFLTAAYWMIGGELRRTLLGLPQALRLRRVVTD